MELAEIEEAVLMQGQTLSDRHLALEEHWGSSGRAMLSLYMAVTLGVEWTNLADPLLETTFFIGYIAFLTFSALHTFVAGKSGPPNH